jgi:ubiquinone/menaquinone biosynthesis C-methylase UbiE
MVDEAGRYFERSEASLASRLRNRRDGKMIARALGDVPAGIRMLDLACGTGRFSSVLLKRGYKVFSLDRSWDMARFIKKRFTAGSPECNRVVYADSTCLPYKDKSLDGIVSFRFLFHHLEDGIFEGTLREAVRVCRRHILFDVRVRRPILDPFLAWLGKPQKDGRPIEDLMRRTESVGLIVEETIFISRHFSRKAVLRCRVPE